MITLACLQFLQVSNRKKFAKKFNEDLDEYSIIMIKTLADRLAEAFAEELHAKVRKELWGYSTQESLDMNDILNVKYQGIRPAPGYPSPTRPH